MQCNHAGTHELSYFHSFLNWYHKLFVTWSPRSSWPFNSWVIVCFLGSSLFLYRNVRFTFPDLPSDLFPLTLIRGYPKYYGIFVITPVILMQICTCINANMHMYQSIFHNICISFAEIFGNMKDLIRFPMNSASTQTINYSEKSQHFIHITISISQK